MVDLDILSNIVKQLAKIRGLLSENTIIFERLFIIIFMEEFYQFFFVIGQFLWKDVCIEEDFYSKMLWKNFNTIITLIQQMYKINNSAFNMLL